MSDYEALCDYLDWYNEKGMIKEMEKNGEIPLRVSFYKSFYDKKQKELI